MRLIITLLLLIPSLSWGLTFKDGKQVDGSSFTSTISKNGQSLNQSIWMIKKSLLVRYILQIIIKFQNGKFQDTWQVSF